MSSSAAVAGAAVLAAALSSTTCLGDTMRLTASTPLTKILRTAQPGDAAEAPAGLLIQGAKGETVSGQIAVEGASGAGSLTAGCTDLKSADGKAKIDASAVRLQWVRYLHLSQNTKGVPADELVAAAPVDIPDAFWEGAPPAEEAAGGIQPLWVEISIPPGAVAGSYTGEISVTNGSGTASITIRLLVRSFALSKEPHQRVIQWWDMPGRHFGEIEQGSAEYWKRLRQLCTFVRSYRQTDVWAPWSLVRAETGKDGKQKWDAKLLEKYVDTAFSQGIRAVHLQGAARHTTSQLLPGSRTAISDESLARLAAVQALVKKRAWKGRLLTALADEPFVYNESSFRELLGQVKKLAPDVHVVEAVETEYLDGLDIAVPKLSHLNLWWPHYDQMKRSGKTVWFYTCCHPVGRYANRFLDQQLVAARELHWMSYLYGLDGYLHWGLNWFAEGKDPYSEEGRLTSGLPPGDSQVAYPARDGWVGSMRLAAMRDGLQDYEYLWTLEDRVAGLRKKLGEAGYWIDPRQRPVELCRRVVQSFYDRTRDGDLLLATRNAVADEIDALSASPLLYVQTSSPEGSKLPAGPIMVNVRGVTEPGAEISINGEKLEPANVSPEGVFVKAVFLDSEQQDITVEATAGSRTARALRSFKVTL